MLQFNYTATVFGKSIARYGRKGGGIVTALEHLHTEGLSI